MSNPDGLFGHALVDMMKRGTELIVVDPRATWLATRAKYFLQLRPGTDAALYLSMCHVIISEDLYDHDFCDNWVYGFKEFTERCAEYPPALASSITGVPEELIVEAARYWATEKPGSMTWGLAVDEKVNGIQTAHLVLLLCAIAGNLDVPGGVLLGGSDREAPTSWWGWTSSTTTSRRSVSARPSIHACPPHAPRRSATWPWTPSAPTSPIPSR